MNETHSKFNLASFAKVQKKMIASNEAAWDNPYGFRSTYKSRIKEYTPEEVENIIASGSIEAQQRLSRNYFYKDGFYKRILIYYATLLKYAGLLIPNPAIGKKLSETSISRRYYDALNFVERINIPFLCTNWTLRALIDGCYYGIIQSNDKNNLVILDLPSGYCISNFKDIYGNDIIDFDTSYFNTITDENSREETLSIYPRIIARHYRLWSKGKVKTSWIRIPSNIGICFPSLCGDGRPLFLNVIPATIQYNETVEVERERDLEEIRKIIVQKIPHLNDGGLLFEPEEAEQIHAGTVGMMKQNKNVSVLTTYADVDSIVSKTTSDAVSNNLEKMVQHIYHESGVSGQIFAATGNLSIETSIKNDVALMMTMAHKFSNFFSVLINKWFGNSVLRFKYTILPISYYNESDYINDSFKLAQSGYSFMLPALALGMSQQDLPNIKELENTLLKLDEKLKPLNSAYTQSSSSNEGGAPKKDNNDKTSKTIQNEEAIDKQGGSN